MRQYSQQYFFGPRPDVGTNMLLLSHPRLRGMFAIEGEFFTSGNTSSTLSSAILSGEPVCKSTLMFAGQEEFC